MNTLDLDQRQTKAFFGIVAAVGIVVAVISGGQAYSSGGSVGLAIPYGGMWALLTYILLQEYYKTHGEVPLA